MSVTKALGTIVYFLFLGLASSRAEGNKLIAKLALMFLSSFYWSYTSSIYLEVEFYYAEKVNKFRKALLEKSHLLTNNL